MNLHDQVRQKETIMFHAGIDLHKKYSYIVVLNNRGDVVSQDRAENDTILAYREAFPSHYK
jgi:hypothetical protein